MKNLQNIIIYTKLLAITRETKIILQILENPNRA